VEYAPPALFVAWRDPDSRRISPVGRLLRLVAPVPGYEFAYIQGANSAGQHGFQPFVAFPDLNKVYRSRELLPFFKNRVLSPSRPDYEQHLASLDIEGETVEPMTLLALSGGRRATDLVEVFPDWISEGPSGPLKTRFLLRGVQYVPGAEERIRNLRPGDVLHCLPDTQNPVNAQALKAQTEDGVVVGYLPDYFAADLTELLTRSATISVRVLRTNPPPVPRHHRVLCSIVVEDSSGMVGFRSDVFNPISREATSIDAKTLTSMSPTRAAAR
jgi:HIRAN domain-containing protein